MVANAWAVAARADEPPATRALPAPVHAQDLQRVERRAAGASVAVRIREDLGPHYRPRHVYAEGVATLVRFGADDDSVVLVMPLAPLHRADQLSIIVDGAAHAVSQRWASPMFDLVALIPDEPVPLPLEAALSLAEDWPIPPTVHALDPEVLHRDHRVRTAGQPILRGRTPPAGILGQGDLHAGHLDARPLSFRREVTTYVLSPFVFQNGTPILDGTGHLVALSSVVAPNGSGFALAIPMEVIGDWYAQRHRIEAGEHGIPAPETRIEMIDLTTGPDALRPTRIP